MAKKKDEQGVRIVGEILVRIVYFTLGAAAFIVVGFRMGWNWVLWQDSAASLVLGTSVFGLATAAFGPMLYRRVIMRGRGTLGEVKKASRVKWLKR